MWDAENKVQGDILVFLVSSHELSDQDGVSSIGTIFPLSGESTDVRNPPKVEHPLDR